MFDKITKILVTIISFVTIAVFTHYHHYPKNRITITEMLHRYKNYVIVEKYEHDNEYYITLKNPYKWDAWHTNLNVISGIYYSYSVGDTIGHKKQIYFN